VTAAATAKSSAAVAATATSSTTTFDFAGVGAVAGPVVASIAMSVVALAAAIVLRGVAVAGAASLIPALISVIMRCQRRIRRDNGDRGRQNRPSKPMHPRHRSPPMEIWPADARIRPSLRERRLTQL
jgi:hypothetical protein